MTPDRFVLGGEVYLTLDSVASLYRVETDLLAAICDLGLLESVERVEDSLALAAAELDRLAEILRLHVHFGVDLESVALLLEGAA